MLTYCHAPAHSCLRLLPCEDRALTIRGFPRPAACRGGCKGFLEYGPLPNLSARRTGGAPLPRHRSTFSVSSEDLARPPMGGGSYNRKHRASPSPHRGGDARRAEGVCKWTENCPQMRLDCLFISRKGRKGRRTSNANYASAEVVASYARQRAQRQIVDEDGKLSHTKHQSADTCHHWGACGLGYY